MQILFKVISESFAQAIQQLLANKLRSFLSLLGITIGIFCIISVKSAVNSLEDNIRSSFEKLGDDVIYISKLPWNEDPHENYWKYMRRPNPTYEDFQWVSQKVKSAELVSFSVFIGGKTLKYMSNSVDRAFALAITYDYADLFKIEFDKGRFFTPMEYSMAKNQVILGNKVASELFGAIEPIGKEVKVMGHKMEVIGVIKKSGKDLINPVNFDDAVLVSYETAKHMVNVKPNNPWGTSLNVKAAKGISLDQLKDEVTGVMRAHHHLRPREGDDFSMNELTMITSFLDGFFKVLNMAGFIIGIFAMIVGMFSVANIMFVSVKERTNLIGIKKAIGAKRYMILLEFLIESIILCIIGGILGLVFVFAIITTISHLIDFDMYLSLNNALIGIGASVFVGILSGFIPAIQASNMDPVVAIRQG